jgi:hypothetical protein
MPSSKPSTLVFFVPGIMGSSLYEKECSTSIIPADKTKIPPKRGDEIWGKDAGYNLGSLLKRPNLFDPDNIVPGKVIPYINVNLKIELKKIKVCDPLIDFCENKDQHINVNFKIELKKIKVYDPLIDFCENKDQLALVEGNGFFPFAYNWLQDNDKTAKDLAKFIREQDKKGDSNFCLIAHSMGGIVSRLMLSDEENKDIAEKTKFLFQIATPAKGSVKAYLAIKNSPISLFPPLYRFLRLIKKRNILTRIKEPLEKCPSLYQLLPPDVTCLCDENGTPYYALDPLDPNPIVWDKKLHSYISDAIAVHKSLAKPIMPSIKVHCIYSDQHKTPIQYMVKPHNHSQKFEVIKEIPSSIKGDGTVTCASATAYSRESDNLHLIQGKPSDHLGICHNEKVYAILKSEFNKLEKLS